MSSKLREALTKVSDVLETWCDHLPPTIQDEAKEALAFTAARMLTRVMCVTFGN